MTSGDNKSRFGTHNDYKSVKYNQLSCFDDIDHSLEDNNEFELKNRQNVRTSCGDSEHRVNRQSLEDYIAYEVKGDESLRAIALRYGCSVSQIKQINHLVSDQDFYGLRVIKLPVKKYGILSDVLVHQINSQTHDTNGTANEANSSLTVNIGISQHMSATNGSNSSQFLSHMDADLSQLRQTTQTVIQKSSIHHLERHLVDNNREIQLADQTLSQRSAFACDESDYGINWCNLLLLAFVVCFLLPIIYVLYISESQDNHNNTDIVSNHHIYSHN